MHEPWRVAVFGGHISRPVEIDGDRPVAVAPDMSPRGLDEAGQFGRRHAAIMHGGEQCPDLYRIGIPFQNDRQCIRRLRLAERTAVAYSHRRRCNILGEPFLWGRIVADAGETLGNVFRRRLTFKKNAGAKGKWRCFHQCRLLPAVLIDGGRRVGFFLRIIDQIFGLCRQGADAQAHGFGKGGGAQALAGAEKELVPVFFP